MLIKKSKFIVKNRKFDWIELILISFTKMSEEKFVPILKKSSEPSNAPDAPYVCRCMPPPGSSDISEDKNYPGPSDGNRPPADNEWDWQLGGCRPPTDSKNDSSGPNVCVMPDPRNHPHPRNHPPSGPNVCVMPDPRNHPDKKDQHIFALKMRIEELKNLLQKHVDYIDRDNDNAEKESLRIDRLNMLQRTRRQPEDY